jgi:multiple sugar transport system substrate-binding protein
MRRVGPRVGGLLAAGAAAVALSGCFGSGGDAPPASPPSAARNTKLAQVDQMSSATGQVDYCTDPSRARREAAKRFTRRFARQGLSARIVPLPTDTGQQHREFVRGVVSCDVFDSDVIWMADLAARGRVYNMGPYIAYATGHHRSFIDSTLKTAVFDGRYWGVPHTTNAGFLFYDKRDATPRQDRATWKAVYATAATKRGIAYQTAPAEPLTVNFLEVAFAAGGRVLSPDGARSVIDSPENAAALRLMVGGIRDHALSGNLGQSEDESRDTFAKGATFMRNWPKAFDDLERRGLGHRFGVMALPIFDGAGVAGVLGGANLVIDDRSDNPGGALKLIDFLTSPEQQVRALAEYSEPAVLAKAYKTREVQNKVSFADELLRAVRQGRPRPVSPAYERISDAIARNVFRALSDPENVSPEQALRDADDEISAAIKPRPSG